MIRSMIGRSIIGERCYPYRWGKNVLQGGAPPNILYLLPTATSYMTRSGFVKIKYPTWMLPVFQGKRPYRLSLSYLLLPPLLRIVALALLPINTVYNKIIEKWIKNEKKKVYAIKFYLINRSAWQRTNTFMVLDLKRII